MLKARADVKNINGPAVLWTIFWDSFKNIGFFGIAMVVIMIITESVSWWAGLILFAGFVLVALFSVVHQLVTWGTNLVYLFSIVFGSGEGRGKALIEYVFLAAANVIQLIEMGFMVMFAWIIYDGLFP